MCVKVYFNSNNRICGLVFSAAHVQFTLIFRFMVPYIDNDNLNKKAN